jgi:hypothetical protein
MEDPSYAYLHYDLLDRVALTTITLRVKLRHINMHEQYLQRNMFVKVEIESKAKGGFEKGTCILSLQLNQQPLCHQFLHFNPS